MIEKAIEKIKAEMKENKDPGIQQIGMFLLKQIEINKNVAKNIVKEDKTIAGSYEYMGKKALEKVKEKKGMQRVYLSDAEGYKCVMEYFEFEAVQDEIMGVQIQDIKEEVTAPVEEVKAMAHCVGGYAEKCSKGETDIVFIRKKDNPNKAYVTMEVRNGEVIQVRAYRNGKPSEEVMEFVEQFKIQVLSKLYKKKSRKKVA